uniref:Integrase catalytic domain-containing protein n=1 Tax=Haemonchus contortus TaxID=6289 RepID=A0A7I4YZL8_HAECO
MPPGGEQKCIPLDSEVQSQPDSTSDSHGGCHTAKAITAAPVPKTYIRMPRKGFPPNPMPENYVRLDQITDELYDMFCKEVLDDAPQPCTPQERKLLDNMSSSGDFGAAVDFYDEIMGELPVVMVHMRTSKVFLSPSLRDKCIQKVIAVKKREENPICTALAHIQQLFVGFPPEIRLRHMLVAELERQEPGTLSDDDKRLLALPPSARYTARPAAHLRRCSAQEGSSSAQDSVTRRMSSRIPKPKEKMSMDSKGDIITINATQTPPPPGFSSKITPKPKPLFINLLVPLDDVIYDKIAEVLAERCTLESIEDEPLRLAIENIRNSGEVMVEEWTEEQFFCPPGLRLRVNDDVGRIYLRKSEVNEVWRMCYATLHERSQNEILSAVDSQYVGIATKSNMREVSKYDLLKGARVVFPAPPRAIGRKPMQYVQIDILVMEETMYGERSYSQALFLTDLYSGYTFARALTDSPDLAIIVRHVMDIFGSFGPPEVYRTYSAEYSHIIADVMLDIERLFKVPIKNMGVGGNLTRDLVRALYRRAETELMATNRWVEALPFAVIEQNQRPSKFFDPSRTPFEIMFARHAWRDETCPPWVNPVPYDEMELDQSRSKAAKKGKKGFLDPAEDEYDNPHLDSVKDLKMYASSLVMSRKKLKQQVAPVYVPVYNEEGKLVNPGTGFLFQIFDRIYVRNPHYNHEYRASKSRSHIARYFRGIIVDIDADLVDSMYKVLYWEDDPHDVDSMSASEWPAADDTYDCASSWFGPWDVTASTAHLAKLRTVAPEFCTDHMAIKRRTIDMRCRCESPSCTGFAHMKCQRKFSTECCLKSPFYCEFHKRRDRPQEEEYSPADGDNSSRFTSEFMFQHRQPGASETCGPPGLPIRMDNYSGLGDSSLGQSLQAQKRGRYSVASSSTPTEKRYTFRDGVLVELSSTNESESHASRGAPPVSRKRRHPAIEAALQSPPARAGREWSAVPTSAERTESVATTSDEGGHVQFVSPYPESSHSPTPSPTPSACYEVEISPDESSSTQSLTHDRSSCVLDASQSNRRGSPHSQSQNSEKNANENGWDSPEISLKPRVVPSRDHPYERTSKTIRSISPTTRSFITDSLARKSEKTTVTVRQTYTAKAVPTSSKAGTSSLASNGSRPVYRLAAVPRSASHVHPFDAELMAEEKSVDLLKGKGEGSHETGQTAVVTSTSVPRRVYVVKAATSQAVEATQKASSQ